MKQYIVDAFTDRIFSGNPAAVLFAVSEIFMETAAETK
ncbi:MAG: PhzF family phenazine biosynthesis protein [Ruminococcus sp.]|nr:PhzF family phenazine biosynthesis protein [Ruminococcus sp.]